MSSTEDGCASSTRLASAGQRAVAEAARLWNLDVFDPRQSDDSVHAKYSRDVITDVMVASGWGWMAPYTGDGHVEWCGLFAGACWRAAGIDSKWLAKYFASTYRLDLWARYREFDARAPNPRPADGPWRLLAELNQHSTSLPFEPMPGDILMIGDGTPAFGDHITLVESYADGAFQTLEGNGNGLGPDGKRRQGIVRATRRLGGDGYCARRLIRPAPSDLL